MSVLAAALLACLCAMVGGTVIFQDDFSQCETTVNPSSGVGGTKWRLVTKQWGGDISGGVAPGNVKCIQDEGRTVLALESHGDLFQGSSPTAVKRLPSGGYGPRGSSEEWTHSWGYSGYSKTCAPHCDTLRVGSSVESLVGFTGGSFEAEMKTCSFKGVLASMWLYNYSEVGCNLNRGDVCSAEYAEACCENGVCTPSSDKCAGTYISNKEIDIVETPTVGNLGEDATDPTNIKFTNARFSSYTALKACRACACEVDQSTCEGHQYEQLPMDLSVGFHKFRVDWDATAMTALYYIDGTLQATLKGANVVPDFGTLWLGSWFPNAWAGTPDFDTCQVLVRSVTVSSTGPAPPTPPTPTPPTPPTPTPPTPTPPTPPTPTPPAPPSPSPASKCDWETAVVACAADFDCEEWIRTNCTHGEGVTSYCRTDKGSCHFAAGPPTPPTPPTPTPPTPTPPTPTPPTPTPPTPTPPTPTPPTPGCDWASADVDCKDDDQCAAWVKTHCTAGQVSDEYCRADVHKCHFSGGTPTPTPTPPSPPPPKTCSWQTAVVACQDYSDCDDWVTKNCDAGVVASDYCKSNGFCHFVGSSELRGGGPEDSWFQTRLVKPLLQLF